MPAAVLLAVPCGAFDERNVTMLIRIAGLAAIAALTPLAVMAQAGGAEGEAKIRPFEIAVPDEVLDDLRRRLEMTRLPDQLDGAGWDYGAELGYVTELIEYWRDEFDWREQERQRSTPSTSTRPSSAISTSTSSTSARPSRAPCR